MGKFLKIIGIIIAIIIVLIIAGLVTLHYTFTPERVSKMISEKVYKETGRTLKITKLSWSFFPTLHLQINGLSINNAKGFGTQEFLNLKTAEVGVKVMPLFSGNLETTNITVNGLSLNLLKKKSGASNWQDFSDGKSCTACNKKDKQTADQDNQVTVGTTEKDHMFFNVPNVDIQNINLIYNNQQTGQKLHINNLNIKASNAQNNKPFPYQVSMHISKTKPYLKANIQSSGQLILSPNKNQYQIKGASLNADMTNQSGRKRIRLSSVNATVTLKEKTNQIVISPMNAKLYGGSFRGNTTITLGKKFSLKTSGELSSISAKALLTDLAGFSKFSGTGNISYNFLTGGDDLVRNLNGTLGFRFAHGVLQGVALGYLYKSAIALVDKQPAPAKPSNNATKVGRFSSSFNVRRGIMSTSNLTFTTPILQIKGKGSANLNSQRLNFRINVMGMRGSMANLKQNGPTIPFNLTGSFKKPKFQPDLAKLMQGVIQDQIQKQLKKNLPKIQIKGLQGLFN